MDLWARIHGGHEHEPSWIGETGQGSRYGHSAVFHALPESLENMLFEFCELIQKEHAVMGETHFAGPWNMSAPNEAGIGYILMGERKGRFLIRASDSLNMPGTL